MPELITHIAEWGAALTELLGVSIIVIVALFTVISSVVHLLKSVEREEIFHSIRHRLGQGILLGLEFLVAADIIHTVAVELTFKTVGVLAIIVLIRTFLSFTLDVELTGKWPWQEKNESGS